MASFQYTSLSYFDPRSEKEFRMVRFVSVLVIAISVALFVSNSASGPVTPASATAASVESEWPDGVQAFQVGDIYFVSVQDGGNFQGHIHAEKVVNRFERVSQELEQQGWKLRGDIDIEARGGFAWLSAVFERE